MANDNVRAVLSDILCPKLATVTGVTGEAALKGLAQHTPDTPGLNDLPAAMVAVRDARVPTARR